MGASYSALEDLRKMCRIHHWVFRNDEEFMKDWTGLILTMKVINYDDNQQWACKQTLANHLIYKMDTEFIMLELKEQQARLLLEQIRVWEWNKKKV